MNDHSPKLRFDEPYPFKISRLINSHYFFCQVGLIVEVTEGSLYRLVLHNNGSANIDNVYPTLNGAKISFAKIQPSFSTKRKISAEWSDLYNPENGWMEQLKLGPIPELKRKEEIPMDPPKKRGRKKKENPLPGASQ